MLNKNKRGKLFTRRVLFLSGLKATLLFSLIGRLYHLQIVKSDEYKTFSDSNRIKLLLVPPLRGKILDRNNEILAENKNYYRILFDPEITSDKQETINKLSDILKLSAATKNKILKKIKGHKSRNSLLLHDHLTWQDVAKIEVNTPDLPGISIDVGQIRHFPLGSISPHLIGYLGPVSEREIKKNPLLNHPDFKIGRSGMEKSFEGILRGKVGVKKMEVDAFGLTVRELNREESQPGKELKLTIHKQLQEFVGKRFGSKSGSAIIIDVTNGETLSFISNPGFDPNQFTYGVSSDYWRSLIENPDKPLINKAISNQYPPGSTFKLIVALAALKDGVDPDKKIYCPGYMDVGKTRFRCWKEGGHGHMSMKQAIMHSCNVYFFNTSKKIGVDKIAEMARKFGLGSKIGLNLSGESTGLVPTTKWKKDKYNVSWQLGDTLNVGIGQGYMLTTPIQLAVMVSRIASGKNVNPKLSFTNSPDIADPNNFQPLDVNEEHLAFVRDGMRRVINVPGGTAFGSRIRSKDFSMSGKTGTSQVISKKGLESLEGLTKEELKRTKNHALFVGFGPIKDPKYSVAVVVEHGGGGSAAAAPIARDILYEAYKLNKTGES